MNLTEQRFPSFGMPYPSKNLYSNLVAPTTTLSNCSLGVSVFNVNGVNLREYINEIDIALKEDNQPHARDQMARPFFDVYCDGWIN